MRQRRHNPQEAGLDPGACVFRHVSRTARAVTRAYDAGLKKTGLTAHQFNILMTLRQSKRVTVGELASLAGMDSSTVPRASAALVSQGWIAIDAGADRRKRYLALTASGRKKIDAAEALWRDLQTAMLAQYGAAAWLRLKADLRALSAAATATNPK